MAVLILLSEALLSGVRSSDFCTEYGRCCLSSVLKLWRCRGSNQERGTGQFRLRLIRLCLERWSRRVSRVRKRLLKVFWKGGVLWTDHRFFVINLCYDWGRELHLGNRLRTSSLVVTFYIFNKYHDDSCSLLVYPICAVGCGSFLYISPNLCECQWGFMIGFFFSSRVGSRHCRSRSIRFRVPRRYWSYTEPTRRFSSLSTWLFP